MRRLIMAILALVTMATIGAVAPLPRPAEAAPSLKLKICHVMKICHVPPGRPSKFRTITVAVSALLSHLTHGDSLGECPSGCRLDESLCDDQNLCTEDVCNADGSCSNRPVNCTDGNNCTADSCDPSVGCTYTPTPGSCDDGDACTQPDSCSASGTCSGTPIQGCCADSGDCNDSDLCTSDTCLDARCAHSPVVYSNPDACMVASCDPFSGSELDTPRDCADNEPCTDDSCDPTTGCVHTPLFQGFCQTAGQEQGICRSGVCSTTDCRLTGCRAGENCRLCPATDFTCIPEGAIC